MKLLVSIVFFLVLSCFPCLADFSNGFDFPVGYPDAQGWKVRELGGYGFLDRADYDGQLPLEFHPGEDWNKSGGPAVDKNEPVFCCSNGKIVEVKPSKGKGDSWGNVVLVEHQAPPGSFFILPTGEKISTLWSQYGHLAKLEKGIENGREIKKGDILGYVGDYPAGSGTNYHLHFEIRIKFRKASEFVLNWPKEKVLEYYCEPTSFILANRQLPGSFLPVPPPSPLAENHLLVTSILPMDKAENVWRTSPIVIRFSEPVQTGSVSFKIEPIPIVPLSYVFWEENDQVMIIHGQTFHSNQKYTVSISAQTQSKSGKSLYTGGIGPYLFSFITCDSLLPKFELDEKIKNLVLVLDRSGSIRDAGAIPAVEAKAKEAIPLLGEYVEKVELINFSTQIAIDCQLTNSQAKISQSIEKPSIPTENTALYDALTLAVQEAAKIPEKAVVMVFTDGQENASKASLASLSALSQSLGVAIITVGFGNIDRQSLGEIARVTQGRNVPSDQPIEKILEDFYQFTKTKEAIGIWTED